MTSDEKQVLVEFNSAISAQPGICQAHHILALDADHPSLVRYKRRDENLKLVRGQLKDCVAKIESRLFQEKLSKTLRTSPKATQ